MSINKLLLWGLTLSLFYSSCGVISKARYGNGYKLNLEWGKDEKPEYVQAKKAEKKQIGQKEIKPIETTFENPIINNESEETIEILTDNNEANEPIKKLNLKEKIKKKKEAIYSNECNSKEDKLPMEKHVKIGAYLFYGGFALFLLLYIFTGISIQILFILLFLLLMSGFILSIISYIKNKKNNFNQKGKKLALSIILIVITFLTFLLFVIGYYLFLFHVYK